MKYALVIIVAAILVGGAAYTYVKTGEQKNQELELVARKAEAAQKKAIVDTPCQKPGMLLWGHDRPVRNRKGMDVKTTSRMTFSR